MKQVRKIRIFKSFFIFLFLNKKFQIVVVVVVVFEPNLLENVCADVELKQKRSLGRSNIQSV